MKLGISYKKLSIKFIIKSKYSYRAKVPNAYMVHISTPRFQLPFKLLLIGIFKHDLTRGIFPSLITSSTIILNVLEDRKMSRLFWARILSASVRSVFMIMRFCAMSE